MAQCATEFYDPIMEEFRFVWSAMQSIFFSSDASMKNKVQKF